MQYKFAVMKSNNQNTNFLCQVIDLVCIDRNYTSIGNMNFRTFRRYCLLRNREKPHFGKKKKRKQALITH